MNARKEPAWQISIDENGDKGKRQHIESVKTSGEAGAVVQYVRARVPPTDIVLANYGTVVAPGGDYDLKRLIEPENVPGVGHEGMEPMKPISLLDGAWSWS